MALLLYRIPENVLHSPYRVYLWGMKMSVELLGRFLLKKNETIYLSTNPDVLAAVEAGTFKNGRSHYLKHGKSEGRKWGGRML